MWPKKLINRVCRELFFHTPFPEQQGPGIKPNPKVHTTHPEERLTFNQWNHHLQQQILKQKTNE